jgi:hypothetical protein
MTSYHCSYGTVGYRCGACLGNQPVPGAPEPSAGADDPARAAGSSRVQTWPIKWTVTGIPGHSAKFDSLPCHQVNTASSFRDLLRRWTSGADRGNRNTRELNVPQFVKTSYATAARKVQ